MSPTNKYYPSPQKAGPLHDDLRLLFHGMYETQDKLAELHRRTPIAAPAKRIEPPRPTSSNGPSNTKLTGLYVKGTPPPHGGSPFYNQQSGQFEYQTAAGAVAPPAHTGSSGTPGQIAYDATHIYLCVGTNSWLRAALSGGF